MLESLYIQNYSNANGSRSKLHSTITHYIGRCSKLHRPITHHVSPYPIFRLDSFCKSTAFLACMFSLLHALRVALCTQKTFLFPKVMLSYNEPVFSFMPLPRNLQNTPTLQKATLVGFEGVTNTTTSAQLPQAWLLPLG